MGMLFSLFMVGALIVVAYAGVAVVNMQNLFGVVIPYAAIAIFLAGVILKVLKWSRSPVPFHIPTTCGQAKSPTRSCSNA